MENEIFINKYKCTKITDFIGYQTFLNDLLKKIKNRKEDDNIFVIIGNSGTGKTSIADFLLKEMNNEIRLLNCTEEYTIKEINTFFDKIKNQFDITNLLCGNKKRFGVIIDDLDLLDKLHCAEVIKLVGNNEYKKNNIIITAHPIFLKKAQKITKNIFQIPAISKVEAKQIINNICTKEDIKLKSKNEKKILENFNYDICELINSINLETMVSKKDTFIDLNFYELNKLIFYKKLSIEEIQNIIELNEFSLVYNMIFENILTFIKTNIKKKYQNQILMEIDSILIYCQSFDHSETPFYIFVNKVNSLFTNPEYLEKKVKDIEFNFTNIYTQLSIETNIENIINFLSEKQSSELSYLNLLRSYIIYGVENSDPEINSLKINIEDIQNLVYLSKNKEDEIRKIYTNKNFKKKLKEDYMSSGIDSTSSESSANSIALPDDE